MSPAMSWVRTELLIERMSVLLDAACTSSCALPHDFQRIVSLGVMVKPAPVFASILLGGPNDMCSLLNGPVDPDAENSQLPAVVFGTNTGLLPVSKYV